MKTIYKIDMAVIMLSVFVLILLVGYARPLVIAPMNDYKTNETEILFSIENADRLLIDDNYEFTTPDIYNVEDGMKINLAPGDYYWKAAGVVDSDVRTLKIQSEVNLELKKIDEEHYGIINRGNVAIRLEVYNGSELIEQKKIPAGEGTSSIGTKFVGGLDG